MRKKIVHLISKINLIQQKDVEVDKKVYFCFIKLFRGVATKFEFYLPYLS